MAAVHVAASERAARVESAPREDTRASRLRELLPQRMKSVLARVDRIVAERGQQGTRFLVAQ